MIFKEQYHKFYGDLYRFHEKHHAAETPEDWNALAKESIQLSLKYQGKFEKAMLLAAVTEIENNYKNERI